MRLVVGLLAIPPTMRHDGELSLSIESPMGSSANSNTSTETTQAEAGDCGPLLDSSATLKSAATVRYQRYRAVMDTLVERVSFNLQDVQLACRDERPAFVTRLVNDLERSGWIVREDVGQAAKYRWNSGRGEFSPSRWLDEKLFGAQIKASPEQERPRERLLADGAENLRISELLAILIRSGRPGESAVLAGEKAARAFHNRLKELPAAGRAELKLISPAIEKTAYCQIMAGIELGRRVAALSDDSQVTQIQSADDAIEYCKKQFARLSTDARKEEFHVVTLDTKHHVIDTHRITVGTLNASLVHPREVFRPAIKDAAAAVILVHNHPSGDATPSPEDLSVTDRLEAAGELLGINVLDHIVLAGKLQSSIRQSRG